MAVPKIVEFYLPVLRVLNESLEPTSVRILRAEMHKIFQPSEEDLQQTVKSGRETKFDNRIMWSLADLKKAGLIERPGGGIVEITDFGRDFYEKYKNEKIITLKMLKENTPYSNHFLSKHESSDDSEYENSQQVMLEIDEYYLSIEGDILDRLKNMNSDSAYQKGLDFERLCLELLKKMGYGKDLHTGQSGDRGIDGILTRDKLGLERIGLQCKCLKDGKVDSKEITHFAHGLKIQNLKGGVFITTTDFTESAKKVVSENNDIPIVLIPGYKLARYMREYEIGVQVLETRYIYDITIGE